MSKSSWFLLSLVALIAVGGVAQEQGVQSVVGNVFLQDATPGIAQIGHANIKGTFRAGQVFVNQASGATIPVVGNNTAVTANNVGGSFSAAGQGGIGVRGTATNNLGGTGIGVFGETRSFLGSGVKGLNNAGGTGVYGFGFPGVFAESTNGVALRAVSAGSDVSSPVLLVTANDNFTKAAAKFEGNVHATHTLRIGSLHTDNRLNISGGGMTIYNDNSSGTARAVWADKNNALQTGFVAVSGPDVNNGGCGLGFSDPGRAVVYCVNVNNVPTAKFFEDANGFGAMQAEIKNFVMPDPDNLQQDIAYACVEGPEAAAYIRGTGHLVGGQAVIVLPRHFYNVAVSEGMTVQLTPRSADSEGLAVTEQDNTHFVVRELRHGKGSYDFAWEVKAVRRGFEDYKVYRKWDEALPSNMDRKAIYAGRIKDLAKYQSQTARP
ncbi:MAG: hypothetical protein JSS66_03660 [Armatimonadetes bacterium]|nr:hypothetical protein [Armatimonadota bacterium]